MNTLIDELREAHAKLRRLEDELLAIKSNLKPARKRIRLQRQALDLLIEEIASGQSSLPLLRTEPTSPTSSPPLAVGGEMQLKGGIPDRNGQDPPAPEPPRKTRREELRQDADLSAADHAPVRRRRGKGQAQA